MATQPARRMPPKVRDLLPDELLRLEANKGYAIELVEKSGIEVQEGEDTPDICDHLIRWWHSLPPKRRPHANDVVWALGSILGDFVINYFKFEWKMLTDQDGEGLVLYGLAPGGSKLVFAPVESVAKRFGDHPDGFVVDLLNTMWEKFEPLARPQE